MAQRKCNIRYDIFLSDKDYYQLTSPLSLCCFFYIPFSQVVNYWKLHDRWAPSAIYHFNGMSRNKVDWSATSVHLPLTLLSHLSILGWNVNVNFILIWLFHVFFTSCRVVIRGWISKFNVISLKIWGYLFTSLLFFTFSHIRFILFWY